MSSQLGNPQCCFCPKILSKRRRVSENYDGPIRAPSGHQHIQMSCEKCFKFMENWIEARKDPGVIPPLPPDSALYDQWERITGLRVNESEQRDRRKIQYADNLIEAVKDMSHNNPLRRSVLSIVSAGVPAKEVAEDFGIVVQTVYNARNDEENFAIELQARPGITRGRITSNQIEAAYNFIDEVIPVISGRNYRVQKVTDEHLYAAYFCWCLERQIPSVGKTYFVTNLLNAENIHHSLDDSICDYCFDFERLNSTEEDLTEEEKGRLAQCETHRENWYSQYQFFVDTKKDLLDTKDMGHLVVVHDFTQIKVQTTFYQDLIIVTYHYDQDSPDALVCSYNHFVAGGSSVKNDTNFVVRTWNHLVETGFFDGYQKISVFSDGGPKHYKTTGNANYFGWLAKKLRVNLTYHFFETNHGHSACDASASHAKKLLKNTQRDSGKPIKFPEEIVRVIEKVHNTSAFIAPTVPEDELPFFNTFRGIRAMHKFEFTGTHVLAFNLSKDHVPAHKWALKTDFFDSL